MVCLPDTVLSLTVLILLSGLYTFGSGVRKCGGALILVAECRSRWILPSRDDGIGADMAYVVEV